ncbi:MAG: FimB/Mfa2 family fimbrial subunit [Mucilaginibacter sp.]
MKKAFLYVLFLSVIFFSCKKEHQKPVTTVNNTGKYFKVNFTLGGFTETILNSALSKRTDALSPVDPSDTSSKDSLNTLYYVVYGPNATQHSKTLTSTNGKFPTIADSLKIGNYDIVFVAGKTGLSYLNSSPGYPANAYYDYVDSITTTTFNTWHDTFTQEILLKVTGGDTTINVNLYRIVGKLQISIKDTVPTNADHINIYATNVVQSVEASPANHFQGRIYNLLNKALIYQASVPTSAKGKPNYTIANVLAADSAAAMTVEVMAYDSSNNLIGDAVINNVTLIPNKKTILTGNLFGGTSTTHSLPIGINTQWTATPYKTIGF